MQSGPLGSADAAKISSPRPIAGPAMRQYRGRPSPRAHHLKSDLTVARIGFSPGSASIMTTMGNEMAAHLAFPLTSGLASGAVPMVVAPEAP